MFFPRTAPRPGPHAVLLAIGRGALTLEDGCLWLRNGDERHLVIWPPGYGLALRSGDLTVLSGSSALVGRVGDKVKLLGGEITDAPGQGVDPDTWVESMVGEPVPPPCRLGRYWLSAGA